MSGTDVRKKQPCPAADECAGPSPETLAYSAARYAPPRSRATSNVLGGRLPGNRAHVPDYARTTCDGSKEGCARPRMPFLLTLTDATYARSGAMRFAKPEQAARRPTPTCLCSPYLAGKGTQPLVCSRRPARIRLCFFRPATYSFGARATWAGPAVAETPAPIGGAGRIPVSRPARELLDFWGPWTVWHGD